MIEVGYILLCSINIINHQPIIVWICLIGLCICFVAATVIMIMWHKSDNKMKELLK